MNYQSLVGKVIVFGKDIDDMEGYAEKGMRARIVAVKEEGTDSKDVDEHVYIFTFDYTEYEDFNRLLETANWYDNHGVACLTARQAGCYKVKEDYYFGTPVLWPFEKYFVLADDNQTALMEEFKATGQKDYVFWLENELTEARGIVNFDI